MREVLIHLNIDVEDTDDDQEAVAEAVTIAVQEARKSREDFEALIAMAEAT